MGNIYNSVDEFKSLHPHKRLVVTSGGFDPLHVGHLRCLQESAWRYTDNWQDLLVIVNGDGFLMRKKGFVFMPLQERMEIIAGIHGVDYVVPWDDGTQFVTGALDILRPEIFTKGGDRSTPGSVPEFELCKNIGCQVIFGVGGTDKLQSSSDLVKNFKAHSNSL